MWHPSSTPYLLLCYKQHLSFEAVAKIRAFSKKHNISILFFKKNSPLLQFAQLLLGGFYTLFNQPPIELLDHYVWNHEAPKKLLHRG